MTWYKLRCVCGVYVWCVCGVCVCADVGPSFNDKAVFTAPGFILSLFTKLLLLQRCHQRFDTDWCISIIGWWRQVSTHLAIVTYAHSNFFLLLNIVLRFVRARTVNNIEKKTCSAHKKELERNRSQISEAIILTHTRTYAHAHTR